MRRHGITRGLDDAWRLLLPVTRYLAWCVPSYPALVCTLPVYYPAVHHRPGPPGYTPPLYTVRDVWEAVLGPLPLQSPVFLVGQYTEARRKPGRPGRPGKPDYDGVRETWEAWEARIATFAP